ncbi:hypothetical protein PQU92_09425 [Asticcacaulis sp. BYS171W]|uniref:Uncharacterized protein n=1 Tax=Asticcacaulis aquaticus TaxID=2984212 RepID=A0ABT5HUH2_9CAUL|nr:hypothetical protein [Asticcacaulis aquaticus]MDC7683495.1 hypothetical protein [Asticcacaulis aquaticus]
MKTTPPNTPHHPNEAYLLVRWEELEAAWRMLATPEKQAEITDTIIAIRELNRTAGPEKAVFSMIAATAWLTDDHPVSETA